MKKIGKTFKVQKYTRKNIQENEALKKLNDNLT